MELIIRFHCLSGIRKVGNEEAILCARPSKTNSSASGVDLRATSEDMAERIAPSHVLH
jgi:hypothetical protein